MLAMMIALLLQPPAPAPSVQLPVSLDRVREGLSRPARFEPPPSRPWRGIFRVQVEGWKPFEDSPWNQAFRYGEVRYLVPSTHIEFLQEVTPEEVRASTVHPCCTVTPVIEAVADFVRGRVRAAKETRARREVEEAMRAAGIRR